MNIEIKSNGESIINGNVCQQKDINADLLKKILLECINDNRKISLSGDENHPLYILFDELRKSTFPDSDFMKEYRSLEDKIQKESKDESKDDVITGESSQKQEN